MQLGSSQQLLMANKHNRSDATSAQTAKRRQPKQIYPKHLPSPLPTPLPTSSSSSSLTLIFVSSFWSRVPGQRLQLLLVGKQMPRRQRCHSLCNNLQLTVEQQQKGTTTHADTHSHSYSNYYTHISSELMLLMMSWNKLE